MVAIISSDTFGLFNSSLSQLGGSSQHGQSGIGQAGENVYVNIASGNLVLQRQDDNIQGLGIDASFLRTYNSLGQFDGDNNDDWRLGFSRKLDVSSMPPVRTTAGGATQRYTMQNGVYVSTDGQGAHDTIVHNADGTYTYTEGSSQSRENYDQNGRLLSVLDSSDKGLHFYYQSNSNLIERIELDATSGPAQSIYFEYTEGVNNQQLLRSYTLNKGESDEQTKVIYDYDQFDRLEKVKIDLTLANQYDHQYYQTTYVYRHPDGSSNLIASVNNSDNTHVVFDYYSDDRIKSVKDGNGSLTSFHYNAGETEVRVHEGDTEGTPYQSYFYRFDSQNRLTEYRGEVNSGVYTTTQYSYNATGDLASITDGSNRTIHYWYDDDTTSSGFGNLVLEQDDEGATVAYAYNDNNQLTRRTEYRGKDYILGNTTPTGGPINDATGPDNTDYIYDDATGSKLRFVLSPQGNLSENRYDGLGQLIKTINYTHHSFTAGTEAQIQAQIAALSGIDAKAEIVDFSYNFRGQLETTTTYSDNNGDIGSGDASVTHFVYDARGAILSKINPQGSSALGSNPQQSSFVYDGMGRLLSSVDAFGIATTYGYQDSGQQISVTHANGLLTTQAYDSNRNLVSVSQGQVGANTAFGTTSMIYDESNRLVATTDQNGAHEFTLYDGLGRVKTEVDSEGRVTSYAYDGNGRLTSTTRRWNRVDNTDTWISAGSLTSAALAFVPVADAADRTISYYYDKAGRQQFVKDAEGYITENIYDPRNLLVAVKRYIDAADVVLSGDHYVVSSSSGFRIARSFYDNDKQLIATMDGEGYLQSFEYDTAGNRTKATRYNNRAATFDDATKSDAQKQTLLTQGTLAQLTPSSANIEVSRWYYDGKGQVILSVAENGLATTFDYDLNGQLLEKREYFNALAPKTLGDTLVLPAESSEDRVTRHSYDANGRLLSTLDNNGLLTHNQYDKMGNLVLVDSSAQDANSTAHRTVVNRYDLQGRLTGMLSGNAVEALKDDIGGLSVEGALHESADSQTKATIDAAVAGEGTRYYFDNSGLLTHTIDSLEHKTLFFYNRSGQKVREVAADGTVTDIVYNHFGEVEQRKVWVEQIPVNTLASLTGGLSSSSSYASVQSALQGTVLTSQSFYNKRGLVKYAIDTGGIASSFSYNAYGEVTQSQSFGHLQVVSETQQTFTSGAKTRIDALEFDNRGLQVKSIKDVGGLNIVESQSYDGLGRLVASVDARGSSTSFVYDNTLHSLKTTMVDSSDSTVFHDVFGRVTSVVDYNGNTSTSSYDSQARQLTQTSSEGLVSVTQFNEFGEVVSVASDGVTQSFQYDAAGNQVASFLNGELQSKSEFDSENQVVVTVDGNGNQVTFARDELGRVSTQVMDPNGLNLNTTYKFDGRGLIKSVSTPGGRETVYTYNDAGQLELEQVVLSKTGETITDAINTHYGYDDAGNRTQVVVGYGTDEAQTIDYVYDNLGRIKQELRYPSASVTLKTEYGYDAGGNLISKTLPDNQVLYYAYDTRNRLILSRDQIGKVNQTQYDHNDNVVGNIVYRDALTKSQFDTLAASIISDGGYVDSTAQPIATTYLYDTDNRRIFTVSADKSVVENRYNSKGLVKEQIRYFGKLELTASQQTTYDTLLNSQGLDSAEVLQMRSLLSLSNQDQHTTTLYDDKGQARFSLTLKVLTSGEQKAIVKESRFDANGNIVFTRALADLSIDYNPDISIDALVANIEGNADNLPTATRSTRYFYDAAGRLRFTLDSGGSLSESQYNSAGQLADSWLFKEDFLSDMSFRAAFDQGTLTLGDIEDKVATRHTDAKGRHTHSEYDKAGRLTDVTDAAGNTESYSYYKNGLKDSFTNKLGKTWHYYYDGAGRLTEETGPQVIHYFVNGENDLDYDNVVSSTAFEYDVLGNVLTHKRGYRIVLQDGTIRPPVYEREQYFRYDDRGQQSLVYSKYGVQSEDSTSQVSFNTLGQAVINTVTQVWSGKEFKSYKIYDDVGQLVVEVDANKYATEYTYDALGNRTSIKRYANQVDITETDPDKLTYASVSTLLNNVADSSLDRSITYDYDNQGRQIRTTQMSFDTIELVNGTRVITQGAPVTESQYNAYGELVEQRVLQSVDNGVENWSATHFYYDNQGHQVLSVDAQGYTTEKVFDALGQMTYSIEYAQAAESGSYDVEHKPQLQATSGNLDDPNGGDRVVEYRYDALGRATYQIQHDVYKQAIDSTNGTWSAYDISTKTDYDALGQVTTVSVGQLGSEVVQSENQYDAMGRLVESKGAASGVLDTVDGQAWDPETSVVDRRQVTLMKYDAYGNLVEQRQLANGVSADNGKDIVNRFKYNAKDQQIEHQLLKQDGSLETVKKTYNYQGQLVRTEQSYNEPDLGGNQFMVSKEVTYDVHIGPYYKNLTTTRTDYVSTPSWVQFDKHTGRLYGTPPAGSGSGSMKIRVLVKGNVTDPSYPENGFIVTFNYTESQETSIYLKSTASDWQTQGYAPQDNSKVLVNSFTFDAVGQQLSQQIFSKNADGTGVEYGQRRAVHYNAFGEVDATSEVAHTDIADYEEFFEYDQTGRIKRSNSDDGVVKQYFYNLAGQLVRTVKAGYGTTDNYLDSLGRIVRQEGQAATVNGVGTAEKPVTTQRYDRWGNVTEMTDALGNTTSYRYNQQNVLVKEIRALAKVVDATGQASYVQPTYSYEYDLQGRLIASKDANGNIRRQHYNAAGLVDSETNGTSDITRHYFDAFGREVALKTAGGYVSVKQYDNKSNVLRSGDIRNYDATGSYGDTHWLTESEFNEVGHEIRHVDAGGNEYLYAYNSVGKVVRSKSPMGVTKAYAFDARGNKTEEWNIDLDQNGYADRHKLNWFYDYFGNLNSINDLGANVYTYHRIADTNLVDAQTSVRLDTTSSGQNRVTTYYDNGQVKRIEDDSVNVIPKPYTEYQYDAMGRVIEQRQYSRSIIGDVVDRTTTIEYDNLGRMIEVVLVDNTQVVDSTDYVMSRTRYQYDGNGNRRSIMVENGLKNADGTDSIIDLSQSTAQPLVAKSGITAMSALLPGRDYDFQIDASSLFGAEDLSTASYSLDSSSNQWMTVSEQNGLLSFHADSVPASVDGSVMVYLTATINGESKTTTLKAKVQSDLIDSSGAIQIPELEIGEGFATTIDGADYFHQRLSGQEVAVDTLSYQLTVNGTMPAWLVSEALGDGERFYLHSIGDVPQSALGQRISFTLKATSPDGSEVSQSFVVKVQDFGLTTLPSSLTISGDQSLDLDTYLINPGQGEVLAVTGVTSDIQTPNPDKLFYFDSVSRTLRFNSAYQGTDDSQVIGISVSKSGQTVKHSITVTVDRAPQAPVYVSHTIRVGEQAEAVLPLIGDFFDLNGDAANRPTGVITADLPTGLALIYDSNIKSYRLVGTPAAGQEGQSYHKVITLTDGQGNSSQIDLSLTVQAAEVSSGLQKDTGGLQVLVGTVGDDQLLGLDGDDSISGGAGDDLLVGGSGNDSLSGGLGNDVFRFDKGHGTDVIWDYYGDNVLEFGPGLSAGDITYRRANDNLVLFTGVAGDEIIIANWFGLQDKARFTAIRFVDGGELDLTQIAEQVTHVTGTDSNDQLGGWETDDTLIGLGGNDGIYGQSGNDFLDGGAGTDVLHAGEGDDILVGGSERDWLYGEGGNDTYFLTENVGDEIVYDAIGSNRLIIDSQFTRNDLVITRANDNLVIQLKYAAGDSRVDRVIIANWFDGTGNSKLSGVYFGSSADAGSLTEVYSISQIDQMALSVEGSDSSAPEYGWDNTDDFVDARGGDDTVYTYGGNDTLIGGTGNDVLYGGAGDDTYFFSDGFGEDWIYDTEGMNTIRLDTDQVIDMTRANDNLGIGIRGTQNRVYLANWYAGSANQNFKIVLNDGTEINASDMSQDGLEVYATDDNIGPEGWENSNDILYGLGGDDVIYSYSGNDTLIGGAGSDYLYGGVGDDTYVVGYGSDIDVISDNQGSNKLIVELRAGETYQAIRHRADEDTLDVLIYQDVNGVQQYTGHKAMISGWYTDNSYQMTIETRTVTDASAVAKVEADVNWQYQSVTAPAMLIATSTTTLADTSSNSTVQQPKAKGSSGKGQAKSASVTTQSATMGQTSQSVTLMAATAGISTSGLDITEPAPAYNQGTADSDLLTGTDVAEVFSGLGNNDVIHAGGGNDQLFGEDGNDDLYGEAGNDTLVGGYGNDKLYGGLGNDTLVGGAGSDIYNWGLGQGSDVIENVDSTTTVGNADWDVLEVTGGIGASDLSVVRQGDDLKLVIVQSGESMTIRDWYLSQDNQLGEIHFDGGAVLTAQQLAGMAQYAMQGSDDADTMTGELGQDVIIAAGGDDTADGGAGDDSIFGGDGADTISGNVGQDILSGGAGNDVLYGGAGNDYLSGGSGDDTLEGGDGNDNLIGGAGNDKLTGGAGSDTYSWGIGSQNDVIANVGGVAGDIDTLELGSGISQADIEVERLGNDLVLRLRSSKETLTVQDWFLGGENRLDTISFADGSTLDADQVSVLATFGQSGTEQADIVNGSDNSNVIDGLGGNDQLSGGSSADILRGGEGDDVLSGNDGDDQLLAGGGKDTVFGGAGNDVVFGGEGADTIDGGAGQDTLSGGDGNDALSGGLDNDFIYGNAGNDTLSGDDGDDILWAGAGDDTVYGGQDNDTISGGVGNDILDGQTGDDQLTGGSGDDTLYGGAGSDTYYWAIGDGNDVIVNNDQSVVAGNSDIDRLVMSNINAEDVSYRKVGGLDLEIVHNQSNERITIANWFNDADSKLDVVEFANGVELNAQTIESLAYVVYEGTSDGDVYGGSDDQEKIFGNQGDDTLSGKSGDDFIYGNDGADTLSGEGGNDTIDGGSGNDILYGGLDDDWLVGRAGNDYLNGGEGNDYLVGGAGNDDYIFGRGMGNDTIIDYDATDNADVDHVDRLRLVGGLTEADLNFKRNVDDLSLEIQDTGETVTIKNWFADVSNQLQAITFDDGSQIDLSTLEGQASAHITGTSADENLTGYLGPDVIDGGVGNDAVDGGGGNDILYGGTGNDWVVGGAGNDYLNGGEGDDYLVGGDGDDDYIFGRGLGHDTIIDYAAADNANPNHIDRLRLVGGLTSADIDISHDGDDLLLVIRDTGDSVRIKNWFVHPSDQLQQVLFDDGSHLDLSNYSGALELQGGDGDDTLTGGNFGDTLSGGAGNDTLSGMFGADWLLGESGNDYLDGGSGDDNLVGGAGNDSYVFARGYGHDTIHDYDAIDNGDPTHIDKLLMTGGLSATDLSLKRSGNDFVLEINDTGESVTIKGWFSDTSYQLQQIVFDDGSALDLTGLESRVEAKIVGSTADAVLDGYIGPDTILGGSGNETLNGLAGDDTLDGGAGNDSINGGDGNDILFGAEGDDWLVGDAGNDNLTGGVGNDNLVGGDGDDDYFFSRGQGNDVIYDYSAADNANANHIDRLRFTGGLTAADLNLKRVGNDFVMEIKDTLESVTVNRWFEHTSYQLQSVMFDDGSTLDLTGLESRIEATIVGSSADAELTGYIGPDTILGGSGNETLNGLAGDDTLSGGLGNDTLNGGAGADMLDGGAGNDSIDGGDDNDILFGAEGDDWLVGGAGNDNLTGGAGNDNLVGGDGDDDYFFSRGQGNDVIYDYSAADNANTSHIDRLRFTEGLTAADLNLKRVGNDFVMEVKDTLESVTVSQWFAHTSYQLQSIMFDDGSTLDLTDLESRVEATIIGSSADAALTGYIGPDTITGGSGNETISALAGDDTLGGGAGADTLDGGTGNDTINGGDGNDTLLGAEGDDWLVGDAGNDSLTGGAGNDNLVGGDGNDDYFFSRGQGNDVIYDYSAADNADPGHIDRLHLTGGLTAADLNLKRVGNDFVVEIKDTLESVTVNRWFEDTSYQLQSIMFDDGSTLDLTGLESRVQATITGGSADAALTGYIGADTIVGGSGNETLDGLAGNDSLTGGAGNDNLFGGDGNDDYFFGRGDGNDVIHDYSAGDGADAGHIDRLHLTGGLTAADLNLKRVGNDFVMEIKDTLESMTVKDWFADTTYRLQEILFDDASTLDLTGLESRVEATITGGTADAVLTGYIGQDTITGGSGNETLNGLAGDDTLDGGLGNDTIDGGDGNDILFGAEGDDWLVGGAGNDNLTGGAGNDNLVGGDGNDDYFFSRGQGNDVIHDYSAADNADPGHIDRLRLTGGLTAADLNLKRVGNDFVMEIKDTLESVTVTNWFEHASYQLQSIMFDDGSTLDLTNLESRVQATITGSSADAALSGYVGPDIITGGSGNETISGLAGDDTLNGGAGNDSLTGGAGNDSVSGGDGNDNYFFGRGDGNDVIHDYSAADSADANHVDQLHLTGGLTAADLNLKRIGYDFVLEIKDTLESVTVKDWFTNTSYQLQQILFDDGSSLDLTNLEGRVGLTITGSSADAELTGDLGADTIVGGSGNETLNGLAGNDSLTGGAGNDNLFGGDGSDNYYFGRGDGNDVIHDYSAADSADASHVDQLNLTGGLTAADLNLTRVGNDFVMVIQDTGESITVKDWFTGADYQLQSIHFDDGSTLDLTNLESRVSATINGTSADAALTGYIGPDTIVGGSGNETISGDAGDDSLDGGAGNDIIYGGDGNDWLVGNTGNDYLNGGAGDDYLVGGDGDDDYIFGRGLGNDIIIDYAAADNANPNHIDRLRLVGGLVESDLTTSRSADDLVIQIIDTSEFVTIKNWFAHTSNQLQAILFDDGSSMDLAAINTQLGTQQVQSLMSVAIVDSTTADSTTTTTADTKTSQGKGNDKAVSGAKTQGTSGKDQLNKGQAKKLDPVDTKTDSAGTVDTGVQSAPTKLNDSPVLMSATTTQQLAPTDGTGGTGGTTPPSGGSSNPVAAEVKAFWFTYDGENRVKVDGGTLNNGEITIADKGQLLYYDADGRQEMVIRNQGSIAEYYHYNRDGTLAKVELGALSGADSFLGQSTAAQVRSLFTDRWSDSIEYHYDDAGRKTSTVQYFDKSFSLNVTGPVVGVPGDRDYDYEADATVEFNNEVRSVETIKYNLDGQVELVESYGYNDAELLAMAKGRIAQEFTPTVLTAPVYDTDGSLMRAGIKVYQGTFTLALDIQTMLDGEMNQYALSYVKYDYDKGGRNESYVVQGYKQDSSHDHLYTNSYALTYREGLSYLEKENKGTNIVDNTGGTGHFKPNTTNSIYDANDNRVAVEEKQQDNTWRVRLYDYNQNGQMLHSLKGTSQKSIDSLSDKWWSYEMHYAENTDFQADGTLTLGHTDLVYAAGQYLGKIGRDGTTDIKSQHFEAMDAQSAAGAGTHVVQAGETLGSIAYSYYGSTDYWYIIADANGLAEDRNASLSEGKTLLIPGRSSTSNAFDSFKPQNLGELIGDTTPSLPYITPPPPKVGCNAIASIIIVAVSVIVTVYTAGLAATAFAGGSGAIIGTGAAAAGGFVGGMAGSLASQAVGVALGVQDGISLKSAFVSGVTSAFTYGMAEYLNGGTKVLESAGQVASSMKTARAIFDGLDATQKMLVAGAGVFGSAVGNKIVGNASGFSWRKVATAVVASGINSAIGGTKLGGQLFSGGLLRETLGGIVNAGVSYGVNRVLGGENKWNFKQVAVDSFGNALGNGLVTAEINIGDDILKNQKEIDDIAKNDKKTELAKLEKQVERMKDWDDAKRKEWARKQIVILTDGTGNRASDDFVKKGTGTNVERVREYYKKLGVLDEQIVYVPGPGTTVLEDFINEGPYLDLPTEIGDILLGGATGFSVSDRTKLAKYQVERAIEFVMGNNKVSDFSELEFKFSGFSRGAATSVNLLNVLVDDGVNFNVSNNGFIERKRGVSIRDNDIDMLLFDMVPAMGLPNDIDLTIKTTIPLDKLSDFNAVHVVAKNGFEQRPEFGLYLPGDGDNIIVVGAQGAHSDVGGGYMDNDNLAQLNFLKGMNELNGMDDNLDQPVLSEFEMAETPIKGAFYGTEPEDKEPKYVFKLRPEAETGEIRFLYHDSTSDFPSPWLPFGSIKRLFNTLWTGEVQSRPIYNSNPTADKELKRP